MTTIFEKNKDKTYTKLIACVIASAIMAFNIKTLVHAGGLYPGGATGLTVLIQQIGEMIFHISLPFTLINLTINAIPIYIGFRYIGKQFTLYSLLMIFLTDIFTDFMPAITITNDIMLITLFGGIMNGLSISICLNAGFTSGGTDFISIFFSQKTNKDSFNLILGINILILGAAGILFGLDKALYSIVFQYISTQAIHILFQAYQKETLYIVTEQPELVCDEISKETNHGATILRAEGAYHKAPKCIVYSVVAKSESHNVIRRVKTADPACFINAFTTNEISGRFYLKPTA